MIPNRFEPQLLSSANKIISQVCRAKMGKMKRIPSSEVDFISSLIENGVDLLEHAWKRILALAKMNVSVAGIFCHQSPKVNIRGSPPRSMKTLSCELADLLVLHSHRTAAKRNYWRGTLEDYDDWPRFSVAAPGFDRRIRDFNGDTRSGQYALVSNADWKILPCPKNSTPWRRSQRGSG